MAVKYNPKKIEKKWQKFWEEKKIFKASDISKKKKFYVLDMFPYPSGAGLHVGHLRGYIATDVIAKKRMMEGFNVLHPMGWDAFGLPAENYAISHKIHPEVAVKRNIKRFKKQIQNVGLGYDWSREINTTDPNYYKWTQWIFLQMFKRGLVLESWEPVNWCPKCKTGLANEDVEEGRCERCGEKIEKKPLRQWIIKITKYAERLLSDLKLLDWEEEIIEQQKNWIGKSIGAEIKFKIFKEGEKKKLTQITIFTTRLDTIFGCTFLAIAPEKVEPLLPWVLNRDKVKAYSKEAQRKSEIERSEEKKKTGVKLKGIEAENPFTGERIPIFVADYVLPHYGSGAIMAVPAHDERDYEFAKKFSLEIKEVVRPRDKKEKSLPFVEDGILINSGKFSGLSSKEAREEMLKWARKRKIGKKAIYYKMRDWVFARQRYWGEPIPLVFCENCKKKIEAGRKKGFNKGELLNPGWIAIPEKDLPVKLPKVKYYRPTGTGESPLANIKKWVKTKCPKCGSEAKRETNTMPQWAGSCWYYLRYIDPKNDKAPFSKKKEKYWMPVDLYVGGAEHATRHLLYARFWHKFLYDIKVVSTKEPFKKLKHVGIILAADGRKMSKRWGNVVNPDDVVKEYGADTLRLYEMFIGPFGEKAAWKPDAIIGMRRFLEKVWKLKERVIKKEKEISKDLKIILHQTIKKVSEDIEEFKFNTAISQLMILLNALEKEKEIPLNVYKIFLKLLAPFAPHISEELFSFYEKRSIFRSSWPQFDKRYIQAPKVLLIVQIDGKTRDKFEVEAGLSQEKAKALALSREKIKKHLEGKKIIKVIFVQGKLINFVTKK